jgi:translation elongation factor EF-4
MVFSGLFPVNPQDYPQLIDAVDRLTLNDSSVTVKKDSSLSLGQGFRLGFLGTLHMDVFRERLEEEYKANIINTMPTVPYMIRYNDGTEKIIQNPYEFPEVHEHSKISEFLEPYVIATLVFPSEYLGNLMELCGSRRGDQIEYSYMDERRVIMKYKLPLAEILTDFYDVLKSKSSGYAS